MNEMYEMYEDRSVKYTMTDLERMVDVPVSEKAIKTTISLLREAELNLEVKLYERLVYSRKDFISCYSLEKEVEDSEKIMKTVISLLKGLERKSELDIKFMLYEKLANVDRHYFVEDGILKISIKYGLQAARIAKKIGKEGESKWFYESAIQKYARLSARTKEKRFYKRALDVAKEAGICEDDAIKLINKTICEYS